MSILDRVRSDIKRFVENDNLFAVPVKITTPDAQLFEINGIHSKHHLALDTDGSRVNSKNAHLSFHESSLTDLGHSIRNGSGEVNLKNYLVEVKDSTGVLKNYKIREWFPDETTGLIVCILGDYM